VFFVALFFSVRLSHFCMNGVTPQSWRTFHRRERRARRDNSLNHERHDTKDTKKTERATDPLAGRDGANGAATQTTAIERL
jgi:hypothetical protein